MTPGFSLEKLGLLALKFPRWTLLVITMVTVALGYAGSRIQFSSDVREIFRSESPDFVNLMMAEEQYPESVGDILLLVEADDLLSRENLERFRDLHLELGFVEGVQDVLSMFSARHPPDASGRSDPVFPFELKDDELPEIREAVLHNPLVSGTLLSEDARTGLFIIAIEPQPGIEDLRRVTTELNGAIDTILAGSDVRVRVQPTGVAFLRLEIVSSLIRDQRTFITVGFAISFLVSWLFFRSIIYATLGGIPAVVAVIWLVGTTQLRGQEFNVLTGVVPALVIVLVVASALHLLFGLRRNLANGAALRDAIAASVVEIGPACVLASATTAIALLSLTLVPHSLVAGFGLTAAIGTAIAFLATITVLPATAYLVLSRIGPKPASDRNINLIFDTASRACARLGSVTLSKPRAVLAGGILLAACAGALYASISPSYQYREYLPEGSVAHAAMGTIDERLGGTERMLVLIQWPPDYDVETTETLEAVEKVHKALEALPLVTSVTSLYGVQKWATEGGLEKDKLFSILSEAESPLMARIMSLDHKSALVTGYFPGIDAVELLPIVDDLESRLADIRASYANIDFVVTGTAVVSARASHEMIAQLNRSLLIAISLNIMLIGLVFRSPRAGLYSILPNLLPIAVAGAALYLSGVGLQFTAVVAFTIGFGISVDSTIHILNYYKHLRSNGEAVKLALAGTIRTIGPVIVVSTAVLIAGFGATLLSELPNLRLFGTVTIGLLVTAFFGDLLVLPATIAFMEERRSSRNGADKLDRED
jgi:predicted RND superfamily exporter protein